MLALSPATIMKSISRRRQKNKVYNKRNATLFFKITQNSKVTISVYIARTTYTIHACTYIFERNHDRRREKEK